MVCPNSSKDNKQKNCGCDRSHRQVQNIKGGVCGFS